MYYIFFEGRVKNSICPIFYFEGIIRDTICHTFFLEGGINDTICPIVFLNDGINDSICPTFYFEGGIRNVICHTFFLKGIIRDIICHTFYFFEGMMRLFLSCPCFCKSPKEGVGRYNTFCGFAVMVIYPALGNGYEYNDYINRIYIKTEAGHFATLG